MEQSNMIPVVKWARKGYATEMPVFVDELPDDGEYGEMQIEGEADEFGFNQYDQEDSRANKRPADICL